MQIKLIFIWMVSHLDSFWNRGNRELGNGLFFACGRRLGMWKTASFPGWLFLPTWAWGQTIRWSINIFSPQFDDACLHNWMNGDNMDQIFLSKEKTRYIRTGLGTTELAPNWISDAWTNTLLQILSWLSSKKPGLGIWKWTISLFYWYVEKEQNKTVKRLKKEM